MGAERAVNAEVGLPVQVQRRVPTDAPVATSPTVCSVRSPRSCERPHTEGMARSLTTAAAGLSLAVAIALVGAAVERRLLLTGAPARTEA